MIDYSNAIVMHFEHGSNVHKSAISIDTSLLIQPQIGRSPNLLCRNHHSRLLVEGDVAAVSRRRLVGGTNDQRYLPNPGGH